MDVAAFRAEIKAYASATEYPDSTVEQYGAIAEQLVDDSGRWGDLRARAVHLVAAHFLTLDTFGAVANPDDKATSDYETTGYGRQFKSLSRLLCAGATFI